MKDYYDRKVAEGKPKRLVINNVGRNLLLRAMAVIKRDSKYLPVDALRRNSEMIQLSGIS